MSIDETQKLKKKNVSDCGKDSFGIAKKSTRLDGEKGHNFFVNSMYVDCGCNFDGN